MAVPAFSVDQYCDDLGPEKIIHIYDPESGLRAIVVIDNTACGPSLGGARMVADVTLDEVRRLARAMTLKNAAAGIPHGGGKAGIVADPRKADKRRLMRAFGHALREMTDFIPGPDMGLDAEAIGWYWHETHRAI